MWYISSFDCLDKTNVCEGDNPFAQKCLAHIDFFSIVNSQIFAKVVLFSSFNEMSVMPQRIQEYNGQQGIWMYQCIYCQKNFSSSQAIAGHTKGHFRDGWVKGTAQSKVFVKFSDYQQQQQQGSATDSSMSKQLVVYAATSETDSTNAHRLPKGDVQNLGSLTTRPLSPASSSRRPPASSSRRSRAPRHHLRVRDLKILARLRARLTGEEQEVILRLLHSAMEQIKKSRKKSTKSQVIPNKDSEATPAIGTTNKDIDDVTIEDSDDESKTM